MLNLELRIPPLLVTFFLGAIMWCLSFVTPNIAYLEGYRFLLFVIFLISGSAIALAGVLSFNAAHTTVNPTKPDNTTSLVKTGIYRYTRNPMYVGFFFYLLGWGFYLANIASIATSFCFIAYMNRYQILPEEKSLQALFGDDFTSYCSEVRRWL